MLYNSVPKYKKRQNPRVNKPEFLSRFPSCKSSRPVYKDGKTNLFHLPRHCVKCQRVEMRLFKLPYIREMENIERVSGFLYSDLIWGFFLLKT